MIGFRFIFDARLLIAETVNNESYVSWKLYIRFKLKLRAVSLFYQHTRIKINPSFVLNRSKLSITVHFVCRSRVRKRKIGQVCYLGNLTKQTTE